MWTDLGYVNRPLLMLPLLLGVFTCTAWILAAAADARCVHSLSVMLGNVYCYPEFLALHTCCVLEVRDLELLTAGAAVHRTLPVVFGSDVITRVLVPYVARETLIIGTRWKKMYFKNFHLL